VQLAERGAHDDGGSVLVTARPSAFGTRQLLDQAKTHMFGDDRLLNLQEQIPRVPVEASA